jgi:transketolase
MKEIVRTFESLPWSGGRPVAIIAKTVKGKGISFMENNAAWHGGAPGKELAETALRETRAAVQVLEGGHD